MPHSLFSEIFTKSFAAAVKSNPEAERLLHARQQSRRRFLRNTALTGAGVALFPGLLKAGAAEKKNIVIVGGGIAGLNAAYQLKKLGYASTLYEASGRVGGRMFTLTDYFGKGLTTDLGGEFVDEGHEDLHQLMKELGLEYYDLRKDNFQKEVLYFDGHAYSDEDLAEALKPFAEKLAKDFNSLPDELTYKNADAVKTLDNLSIKEYIMSAGISGWLYEYLDVMLSREYGMDIDEQSAINFLIMLDKSGSFGEGHEIYKIKGGSQHLTDAVYQKVKDRVKLRHVLTSLKQSGNSYELNFMNSKQTVKVTADYIVMAISFPVLRKIEMDVPMPEGKRKCIDEFAIGNSAKFIMGAGIKPWRKHNQQGYTFTDETFGCGWDSTHMQSQSAGSFSVFGGGKSADKIFTNKPQQLISEFEPQVKKVFQGNEKLFTGKQVKMCWAKQPFAKGGYTSFKKGQYGTIAGWEAEPVGNIFFAGEHVSGPFQGFMNGAAQTGKFAAEAIAEKIKQKKN